MVVLGIDPGIKRIGIALVDVSKKELLYSTVANSPVEFYTRLLELPKLPNVIIVEAISPWGVAPMTVVFTATVMGMMLVPMLGEFLLQVPVYFIQRQSIKSLLVGSAKARDKDVRDYLIGFWGKEQCKRAKVKGDAWSALALATLPAFFNLEVLQQNEYMRELKQLVEEWLNAPMQAILVDTNKEGEEML